MRVTLALLMQHPVEASSAEVATEVAAVRQAALPLCPLEVVLERVIATPTGNVLACWQVLSGSEPADLRRYAACANYWPLPACSPSCWGSCMLDNAMIL